MMVNYRCLTECLLIPLLWIVSWRLQIHEESFVHPLMETAVLVYVNKGFAD